MTTDFSSFSFDAPSGDFGGGGYDFGGSGNAWDNMSPSLSDNQIEVYKPDETDWFTDTTGSVDQDEGSWWGGVWDWATGDQGLAVLGGAAKGVMGLMREDQKYDRSQRRASSRRGGRGGGGGGGGYAAPAKPSPAEIQDARYKRHDASINQHVDMGARKFKK